MPSRDADVTALRQLFSHDTAEWRSIRAEGTTDMRYIAGDPWDAKDRQARSAANRPCLSLDELSQYVNSVINEVRANKRAVKFAPTGNGANDATAEFYADKMREIEYRSRAQIAYTTAFENAVQRSYGFVRVNTRYAHSRAVNQDLFIDPVPNPDLVTPDPEALLPDLSDQKHCWVREPWATDDFDRKWPKAKVGGKIRELQTTAPDWIRERGVFVGEHWSIKTKTKRLLILQPPPKAPEPPSGMPPGMPGMPPGMMPPGLPPGMMPPGLPGAGPQAPPPGPPPPLPEPVGMFEDELDGGMLPPGYTFLSERQVEHPSVTQCLTNGIEILDETDCPGKYIPIIACFGKVLFVDEGGGPKRKILSMVRLARDPYMLYCYYRTCEAELVGMTPKFPYFTYKGQLDKDNLENLRKSLHEPVAVIEVDGTPESAPPGQVLPFPQRQPYEPPIQALEIGAEAARRAIQAAMGQTALPTAAQRRSEKSGIALKRINEQAQMGSFHFTDHYLDMVTQVGVVCEDLMDKIYDSKRQVGIRKDNDKSDIVTINDPNDPKSISTKGDYLVTVSTGPSFDSEREAASDFADTLAQSSPEVFALLGPLIVKLKNLGPVGDEIIEVLETVQPPPVQALRASKAKQGDPKQAQAALMQAQAEIQKIGQMAEDMKRQIDTDEAKQRVQIEKAKIDAEASVKIQAMRDATAIAVAHINAATKGLAIDQHAAEEAQALGMQAQQADAGRMHEAQMAAARAEHEGQMSREGHQQALEQGQQQTEAQMALQAAMPPEPPMDGATA